MNISYVLNYKTRVNTRKGSTGVIISSFIYANFCHNLKSSMTLTKGLIKLIPISITIHNNFSLFSYFLNSSLFLPTVISGIPASSYTKKKNWKFLIS